MKKQTEFPDRYLMTGEIKILDLNLPEGSKCIELINIEPNGVLAVFNIPEIGIEIYFIDVEGHKKIKPYNS